MPEFGKCFLLGARRWKCRECVDLCSTFGVETEADFEGCLLSYVLKFRMLQYLVSLFNDQVLGYFVNRLLMTLKEKGYWRNWRLMVLILHLLW